MLFAGAQMNTLPKNRLPFHLPLFDMSRISVAGVVLRAACVWSVALVGCASNVSTPNQESSELRGPIQWHASLPHEGRTEDLQQWWSQFDDSVLPRMIESAQLASPTLAQALASIADARAAGASSAAAMQPGLGVAASATRARSEPTASVASVSSLGLEATWELDLFGANRAGLAAAQARLGSSEANWHDARVSVAAEVARNFVELRTCEAQVEQARIDAASRHQTARATELATEGGILAPVAADLARASAAEGDVYLKVQEAKCELLVKALVALTAREEPSLRRELVERTAQLPQPTGFWVSSVPAEVLAQRPDIHAAAWDVVAASATATQARARRWPRIVLAGNIGTSRMSSSGASTDGTVWGIGPIAISLPLFEAGARRADAEAAKVRFEVTAKVYAARLRTAVQEVEGALLSLQSTATRDEETRTARDGFERAYRATAASYSAGSSNLFDLEDARRSLVSAQRNWIDLRRERLLAWIALYRAVGGGWSIHADGDPGGHFASPAVSVQPELTP